MKDSDAVCYILYFRWQLINLLIIIPFDDLIHNHVQTVYSLKTGEIAFAVMIKSVERVCGYVTFRTEHPKLIIIYETVEEESFCR